MQFPIVWWNSSHLNYYLLWVTIVCISRDAKDFWRVRYIVLITSCGIKDSVLIIQWALIICMTFYARGGLFYGNSRWHYVHVKFYARVGVSFQGNYKWHYVLGMSDALYAVRVHGNIYISDIVHLRGISVCSDEVMRKNNLSMICIHFGCTMH